MGDNCDYIYNHLGDVMVKTVFIFLVLASLACGMQALPTQAVDVVTPSHDVSLPVKVAASHEPTEAAPVYVTTTSLRVRSCASVNCDEVSDPLPAGTRVLVFVTDIPGKDADCFGGEWYAIGAPVEGYVCSIFVKEIE